MVMLNYEWGLWDMRGGLQHAGWVVDAQSMGSRTSSSAVKGLAENRRKGRRHRLDVPATLAAEGKAPIAVKITEMSVGGLGFSSREALEVGAIYQVRAFDSLVPEGMRVKVVSVREVPGPGFEAGAVGWEG